jgi:four helix bundle protein
MGNIEFAKELEKRTLEFAIKIIHLSMKLPNTPEGHTIRRQITKSGTSIGANYREANRSRSKADFKNKINICESEASETQYWLEIIKELKWCSWINLKSDYDECCEILAIFSSISKNYNKTYLRHSKYLRHLRHLSTLKHI